ncbi:MAG TPA: DNA polymerase III subunit chi [Sphingomicrobium sp.]|nr:DNA polymerase III subunit chi [Sphingomicrobium sp.]
MRVDFYQLGGAPVEQVVAKLAQKVVDGGERLLVIASDEAFLARLDRLLWDVGKTGFLPHGLAGGSADSRQPILLSTTPDAANVARNLLIADGEWRDAALNFQRAFYLFDTDTIAEARTAWKRLSGEGVEPHYWTQERGRWSEKA